MIHFPSLNALRIIDTNNKDQARCAILGQHIRITPDLISDYCLAHREAVFEDLAVIVENIAFSDRCMVRKSINDGKRNLIVDIPVFERSLLQSTLVVNALRSAVEFLTGDRWTFNFSHRLGAVSGEQSRLVFPQAGIRHVIPFSDGLDSLAQARFSIDEWGERGVLLVRAGLGLCRVAENVRTLRVPRQFSGGVFERRPIELGLLFSTPWRQLLQPPRTLMP